ncbi:MULTISPECIES: cytochrome P450 [Rhodomicrobium]|uniref:cytochrome P450 n=1 Tax=Rhodomicrobium TaxID=1068 RepID=UPI000B4C1F83|nr:MULTISPECIES: cytochrome P450 [Rhodomicrobium]
MSQNGTAQLAGNIQANFASAQKERNWSLFLFFRILGLDEVQRLKDETLAAAAREKQLAPAEAVKLARARVATDDLSVDSFAGLATDRPRRDGEARSDWFLAFLRKQLGLAAPEAETTLAGDLAKLNLRLPDAGLSQEAKANDWFRQGLLGVCAHECLRYENGPDAGRQGAGLLRSAKDELPSSDLSIAAVDISFTHGGLAALKTVEGDAEQPIIDKQVLDSFPEAFRDGMAVRAERLGDVGRSAPENWDGELGKRTIHGLLTAYFQVTETGFAHWDRIRKQVDAFNAGDEGLRQALALLFLRFGFEVLHVEFGQTPYKVANGNGAAEIERLPHRVEHFGFRDGISQPFIDLGLRTPLPGGGRPAKDGTWAPVAAGEVFLGPPDEDELTADQPTNATLRVGSTYLVLRKLEQDVAGFRTFLASQRSTPKEQERLAAQIVGRWRSGAPLVRHPESDASYVGLEAENSINDFRFFAEDPQGRKCAVGSHIRRSNPRDTGGRDEVKRHRLLRRGMSYGGPLLPEDSLGDGRERGLLFLAANARIELQFEVIQRDWLNGGEFLGQVGAGRCPLTGSNGGGAQDRFLEAGGVAPICGIPSFVTTKGGEYFFVPSLDALKTIARGERIKAEPAPFGPFSSSYTETPSLLSEARLKRYAGMILGTPQSAVRVELPDEYRENGAPPAPRESFVFVGRYKDVAMVLDGRTKGKCPVSGGPSAKPAFSVAHYYQAAREITRGEDLLLTMDPGGPLNDKRLGRLAAMRRAWEAQPWTDFEANNDVREFIRDLVDNIVHRVSQTGRVDVLQDLAFYIPYRILKKFIGLPGPEHLSELVVALPFAKRNIMKLPPDWLRNRQEQQIAEPGYVTTQMWSRLAFAEVIGNILDKRELTEAAIQGTSEMFTYIDEAIMEERLKVPDPKRPARTLLQELVRQAPPGATDIETDAYFAEVRAILADIMTTISMNIALPFSKAIQAALAFRFDLSKLVPVLDGLPAPEHYSNVELLAYELLRLNPSAPAIFRRCDTTTTLPSGAQVNRGDWVAALLPVACRDPEIFENPNKFSLGAHLPKPLGGPKRDPGAYLLFGPPGGVHRCWGESLGRLVLGELFRAAGKFRGLTRLAGPNGEVVEYPPRMDYALRLKFYPFNPNRGGID